MPVGVFCRLPHLVRSSRASLKAKAKVTARAMDRATGKATARLKVKDMAKDTLKDTTIKIQAGMKVAGMATPGKQDMKMKVRRKGM